MDYEPAYFLANPYESSCRFFHNHYSFGMLIDYESFADKIMTNILGNPEY